jgi:hypothetical protein
LLDAAESLFYVLFYYPFVVFVCSFDVVFVFGSDGPEEIALKMVLAASFEDYPFFILLISYS